MANKLEYEELGKDEKEILLNAFGYELDEDGFILDAQLKEKLVSKSLGKEMHVDSVALTPGSLKIIDASPISMSRFLREREDIEKTL